MASIAISSAPGSKRASVYTNYLLVLGEEGQSSWTMHDSGCLRWTLVGGFSWCGRFLF